MKRQVPSTPRFVAHKTPADHAAFETLRGLMEPAAPWPDGTPRWKTPPCRAHGLIEPDGEPHGNQS